MHLSLSYLSAKTWSRCIGLTPVSTSWLVVNPVMHKISVVVGYSTLTVLKAIFLNTYMSEYVSLMGVVKHHHTINISVTLWEVVQSIKALHTLPFSSTYRVGTVCLYWYIAVNDFGHTSITNGMWFQYWLLVILTKPLSGVVSLILSGN